MKDQLCVNGVPAWTQTAEQNEPWTPRFNPDSLGVVHYCSVKVL